MMSEVICVCKVFEHIMHKRDGLEDLSIYDRRCAQLRLIVGSAGLTSVLTNLQPNPRLNSNPNPNPKPAPQVPLLMVEQGTHTTVCTTLGLAGADSLDLREWKTQIADRWDAISADPVSARYLPTTWYHCI